MHHPGKFTWFEHFSGDPGKARDFYEALFGWKLKRVRGPQREYDMFHNAGEGVAGLLPAPAGTPNLWMSYLSVADVDAAFAAALAAGAKGLMPPADYFGVGRAATIADPAGAVLSLWRGAQGDREDRERTPAGDWVWNELATPDPGAAVALYEKVFGFTHDEMDMGAQGKYHVLNSADGKGRAGVMKSPHAGMPAMWTPYVHVEQADATAARVAPLGGTLLLPPMDVPTVGRIAMLQDPLGVSVAFLQPAVMG
ncbi:VOC family protein [Caenimonas aquaedulcis]|uniref:VOC family protein n=1 Tax=Caenimonas aquaedulcis TaxID=2793270 RepID=A0A931H803_9BURK|nr:VOC family protein [Caenimonas aquaedulcis]MBG9390389.1 VOC family protein [Caenimonas aquaedulcis]